MGPILILFGVTAWAGIVYSVTRAVGRVAERAAGVESLWSVVSIDDKMRLSLARHYQTRDGCPVVRMEFYVASSDISDGFPWRITYQRPDGSKDHGWYNDEGRWTNNPFYITAVDLLEVAQ